MTSSQTKKTAHNGKNPPTGGNMPLFYQNPIPLDKQKHATLGLRSHFGLGFAKGVNAVPINMIEMPQISHFYPIAFSPDESATPVAILGVRDNENLFINSADQWAADAYVPAYIRRYPFIFSEIPGGEQLTLCVDLVDGVTEEGGAQGFFEAGGEPSTLSRNALEFCKSYHAAAQQTTGFSKALHESGILVTREAQITVAQKGKINFSGFRIVDEKKFSELPDETFLEWRKQGWLPFLYAHLFSGTQWQRLSRMLGDRMAREAA